MRLDGSSMLGLKGARSRTLLAGVLGLHTYPLILSLPLINHTGQDKPCRGRDSIQVGLLL